MPFQSSVNIFQGFGTVGDIANTGYIRAQAFNLVSGAQVNTIGNAFTITNGGNPGENTSAGVAGTAQVGGVGRFAGILGAPKEYASMGTSGGGTLAPTLVLPDNAIGVLYQFAEMFVSLPAAAKQGDVVFYDNTTGVLGSQSASASFTGVVATNTLTVSAYVAGGAPLAVGTQIFGANIIVPTFISALGTGTGGNGTYTVTGNATVASSAMTANSVAPAGKTLVPNCTVTRYDTTGSGLAVIKLAN